MINDREKRMEKRRREYQEDKMVYSAIGKILIWGFIIWVGVSFWWWVIANFI